MNNHRARITGDLTLHGVTREAVFDAEYAEPIKSREGGEITMGFTASTMISCEDYGMFWGSKEMKGGGLVKGKEVLITLDVEADRAE
jgi:polyisoprenoid-binding protein YceI